MLKKAKKWAALLLSLTVLGTMISCVDSVASEGDNSSSEGTLSSSDTSGNNDGKKIGIFKWATHDALDSAEQGFIDALAANGYKEGENVAFDRQNANGDPNTGNQIADKLVNNASDLILAIATPAVQTVQSKTDAIPILGTAVTDYEGANLVASNDAPGGNISGTTDMTPVEEQIDLLLKILPDVKKIGVLYNSSEVNSEIQANIAKDYGATKGIEVIVKTFSNTNDIQQTASSLAGETDAFWLPTDNTLATAIGVLSTVATEKKIPLVCAEDGMVKAGGTFTVGLNYYQLGYQTGEMAVRILNDEATPSSMPIERLSTMTTVINKQNADAIGLEIPQEILDSATEVIE